ncbi:MAG: hypothetical protein WCC57_20535, partial [Paracoccaceae bacterium]
PQRPHETPDNPRRILPEERRPFRRRPGLCHAQIDMLARLLAKQIGADRATLAFTSILSAIIVQKAEARLTLVFDIGNADPVTRTERWWQTNRRHRLPRSQASAKLAQIMALAEVCDITGLQALEINPVSFSPKAMALCDLYVIAITARMGGAAQRFSANSVLPTATPTNLAFAATRSAGRKWIQHRTRHILAHGSTRPGR